MNSSFNIQKNREVEYSRKNFYEEQGILHVNYGDSPLGFTTYGKNVKNLSLLERIFSIFTSVTLSMNVEGKTEKYDVNVNEMSALLRISRQTLRKIEKKPLAAYYLVIITKIRNNSEISEKDQNEMIKNLVFNPKKTFKIGGKEGQRYFVQTKPNGEVALYQAEKVAEGSFTKVYKAEDVVTGKKIAVKKAKKKSSAVKDMRYEGAQRDESLNSLKNEHKKLRSIHNQKNIKGIQKAPASEIVDRFYFTSLCEGDVAPSEYTDEVSKISPLRDIPVDKKLQLISGLLGGLKDLHLLGYSHMDIKPDNFLLRKSKSGDLKSLQLADFGSVKHNQEDYAGTTPTMAYIPNDRFTGNRTSAQKRQAWDVFSMSKSIIEILVDRRIEKSFTDGKYFDELVEELVEAQVPQNVAEILASGMKPYQDRPSIDKLVKDFDAAISV